jgi:hypothetical protein
MPRPSKPWFRTNKGAWFVKVQGRQTALGVKGADNEAEAVKAWHRVTGGVPLETHRKPRPASISPQAVPTVAEVLSAFLSDAESRVQPITLAFYRRFLILVAKVLSCSRSRTVADTVHTFPLVSFEPGAMPMLAWACVSRWQHPIARLRRKQVTIPVFSLMLLSRVSESLIQSCD